MAGYTRGTPRNYGGSYNPEKSGRDENDSFHLEEKIDEMLAYALPLVDNFPRRRRRLADDLRGFMFDMEKLVVTLRLKHAKKTTVDNLDVTLGQLKKFVILAADKQFNGEKYAPPLTIHQRDTWSRMNDEIGCMIGGYIDAIKKGRVTQKGKPYDGEQTI